MSGSKVSQPGLLHIGAGNIFSSTIISGLVLGYLVDQWLETSPVFMLLFGVLGFVGGMKRIHVLLQYQSTGKDENDSGS